MNEHPPYEVISHQQARAWRKWTYEATDEQLLAALRGAGDSFSTVPAQECSDELKNRGYILVGAYPREVTLEKPEGQEVSWSHLTNEDEARAAITRWAENHWREEGAPKPVVEVLELKYDAGEEEWFAELDVSTSADNPLVTFWFDENHPLMENRLHIESVEY